MRKTISLLMVAVMMAALLSSCGWAGRVAGTTVGSVQKGGEDLKDGYSDSYENTRNSN